MDLSIFADDFLDLLVVFLIAAVLLLIYLTAVALPRQVKKLPAIFALNNARLIFAWKLLLVGSVLLAVTVILATPFSISEIASFTALVRSLLVPMDAAYKLLLVVAMVFLDASFYLIYAVINKYSTRVSRAQATIEGGKNTGTGAAG
ncbi:MAG: hypothetical protein NTY90_04575 [Candidatus Micrarchaeota archaeon]|nr:hypothetical protein [Candidatus Micrarchaeota archaeon]